MEITNAAIEKLFQAGGAALSGGVLWKFLDIFLGRRKRRIADDGAVVDSAIKLVQSFNEDIERLKKEFAESREEREKCVDNYEKQKIIICDLKVALRDLHSHYADHMRDCASPSEAPLLPESLR